jgi:hypothetical protein
MEFNLAYEEFGSSFRFQNMYIDVHTEWFCKICLEGNKQHSTANIRLHGREMLIRFVTAIELHSFKKLI